MYLFLLLFLFLSRSFESCTLPILLKFGQEVYYSIALIQKFLGFSYRFLWVDYVEFSGFCAAASAAACILRMTFCRNGPSVRSSVRSSVRYHPYLKIDKSFLNAVFCDGFDILVAQTVQKFRPIEQLLNFCTYIKNHILFPAAPASRENTCLV